MLLFAFRLELIGRKHHAIAPRAHDMRARLCYETALFFTRLESQKFLEANGETHIYFLLTYGGSVSPCTINN